MSCTVHLKSIPSICPFQSAVNRKFKSTATALLNIKMAYYLKFTNYSPLLYSTRFPAAFHTFDDMVFFLVDASMLLGTLGASVGMQDFHIAISCSFVRR
jgi:hypothetical protein